MWTSLRSMAKDIVVPRYEDDDDARPQIQPHDDHHGPHHHGQGHDDDQEAQEWLAAQQQRRAAHGGRDDVVGHGSAAAGATATIDPITGAPIEAAPTAPHHHLAVADDASPPTHADPNQPPPYDASRYQHQQHRSASDGRARGEGARGGAYNPADYQTHANGPVHGAAQRQETNEGALHQSGVFVPPSEDSPESHLAAHGQRTSISMPSHDHDDGHGRVGASDANEPRGHHRREGSGTGVRSDLAEIASSAKKYMSLGAWGLSSPLTAAPSTTKNDRDEQQGRGSHRSSVDDEEAGAFPGPRTMMPATTSSGHGHHAHSGEFGGGAHTTPAPKAMIPGQIESPAPIPDHATVPSLLSTHHGAPTANAGATNVTGQGQSRSSSVGGLGDSWSRIGDAPAAATAQTGAQVAVHPGAAGAAALPPRHPGAPAVDQRGGHAVGAATALGATPPLPTTAPPTTSVFLQGHQQAATTTAAMGQQTPNVKAGGLGSAQGSPTNFETPVGRDPFATPGPTDRQTFVHQPPVVPAQATVGGVSAQQHGQVEGTRDDAQGLRNSRHEAEGRTRSPPFASPVDPSVIQVDVDADPSAAASPMSARSHSVGSSQSAGDHRAVEHSQRVLQGLLESHKAKTDKEMADVVKKHASEVKGLEEAVALLEDDAKRLRGKNKSMRQDMEDMIRSQEEWADKCKELERQNSAMSDAAAAANSDISSLRDSAAKLQQQLDQERMKTSSMEAHIHAIEGEVTALRTARADTDKANDDFAKTNAALRESVASLEAFKSDAERRLHAAEEHSTSAADMMRERRQSDAMVSALETDALRMQSAVAEAERKLKASEVEKHELQQSVKIFEIDVASARDEVSTLQRHNATLTAQLSENAAAAENAKSAQQTSAAQTMSIEEATALVDAEKTKADAAIANAKAQFTADLERVQQQLERVTLHASQVELRLTEAEEEKADMERRYEARLRLIEDEMTEMSDLSPQPHHASPRDLHGHAHAGAGAGAGGGHQGHQVDGVSPAPSAATVGGVSMAAAAATPADVRSAAYDGGEAATQDRPDAPLMSPGSHGDGSGGGEVQVLFQHASPQTHGQPHDQAAPVARGGGEDPSSTPLRGNAGAGASLVGFSQVDVDNAVTAAVTKAVEQAKAEVEGQLGPIISALEADAKGQADAARTADAERVAAIKTFEAATADLQIREQEVAALSTDLQQARADLEELENARNDLTRRLEETAAAEAGDANRANALAAEIAQLQQAKSAEEQRHAKTISDLQRALSEAEEQATTAAASEASAREEMLARITKSENALREVQVSLGAKEEENFEMLDKIEDVTKKLDAARTEVATDDERVANLLAEIQTMRAANDATSAELTQSKETTAQLTSTVSTLEAKLEETTQRVTSLQGELRSAQTSAAATQETATAAAVEHAEAVSVLQRRATEAEEEMATVKTELAAAIAAKEEFERRATDASRSQCTEESAAVTNLKTQLDDVKSELATTIAAKESAERTLEEASKSAAAKDEWITAAVEREKAIRAQYEQLSSAYKDLSSSQSSASASAAATAELTAQLSASKETIEALKAELETANMKLSDAEVSVQKSTEAAKSAAASSVDINTLQRRHEQEKSDAVTAAVSEAIRESEEKMQSALQTRGDLWVAEKAELELRLATAIDKKKEADDNTAALFAQIERLTENMRTMDDTMSAKDQQLSAAKSASVDSEEKAEVLGRKLADVTRALAAEQSKQMHGEASTAAVSQTNKELNDTVSSMRERSLQVHKAVAEALVDFSLQAPGTAEVTDLIDLLIAEFRKNRAALNDSARVQQQWAQTYEHAKKVNESTAAQLQDAWFQLTTAKEELAVRDAAAGHMTQQQQQHAQRAHVLEARCEEAELRASQFEREVDQLRVDLEKERQQETAAESLVTVAQEENEELRQMVVERERDAAEAREAAQNMERVLEVFQQQKQKDLTERTDYLTYELDQMKAEVAAARAERQDAAKEKDAAAALHRKELATSRLHASSLEGKLRDVRHALEQAVLKLDNEHTIDKRVVTHLLVNYIHSVHHNRSDKEDIVRVMSGLLNWDEPTMRKAGLLGGLPGREGMLGKLWRLGGGRPLSEAFGPPPKAGADGAAQAAGDNAAAAGDLAKLWVDFLITESNKTRLAEEQSDGAMEGAEGAEDGGSQAAAPQTPVVSVDTSELRAP